MLPNPGCPLWGEPANSHIRPRAAGIGSPLCRRRLLFLFCYFSLRVAPASKQSLAEHVIRHPDVMRQNCRPKTELGRRATTRRRSRHEDRQTRRPVGALLQRDRGVHGSSERRLLVHVRHQRRFWMRDHKVSVVSTWARSTLRGGYCVGCLGRRLSAQADRLCVVRSRRHSCYRLQGQGRRMRSLRRHTGMSPSCIRRSR